MEEESSFVLVFLCVASCFAPSTSRDESAARGDGARGTEDGGRDVGETTARGVLRRRGVRERVRDRDVARGWIDVERADAQGVGAGRGCGHDARGRGRSGDGDGERVRGCE